MTTKEKAQYDFDFSIGMSFVFLQCNFYNHDGVERAIGIMFEKGAYWTEADKSRRPGDEILGIGWAWYERPIVAIFKVKGKPNFIPAY